MHENVILFWLASVSPCHLRIADQFCYTTWITCIIFSFSKLLFLGWVALLGARSKIKTLRNNRESVSNFIYNAYNLPETTFRKEKISVYRNKFNKS